MGTYIYEYMDNVHFENEEELKCRLKTELLEFGENGVSEVRINDREAYLLKHGNLSRPDKEGYISLQYNRYERDFWEPTYVNFTEGKFRGLESRSFGSKIGWSQHYQAMLVAHVLCECYSGGTYIVYGDVGYNDILKVLAYIGKKYGFELVERFIRNRCNLNNFDMLKEPCYHKDQFWGIRGHVFYCNELISAHSFDSWINEMKDDSDLKNAENGERIKYTRSSIYLGVRLLHHMLSREMENINCLDEKMSYDILMKYCSLENEEQYELYLSDLPEDIKKYEKYYRKQSDFLLITLNHPDIVQKCLSFVVPEGISTFESVKNDFVKYYLNTDYDDLSEEGKRICINLKIIEHYHKKENEDKDCISSNCEKVKAIMQREVILDVSCFGKEYEYLDELYCCAGEPVAFSTRLDLEIKRVFSGEAWSCFVSNWTFEERDTEEILDRLFDITEILYERNQLLMREDFFYRMLGSKCDQELGFRMDLLWFILNHYEKKDERFIADRIIENDFLYELYVKSLT